MVKKRSTFKKAYMKVFALPVNLLAAILSLLFIPVVRGYRKA